jgi:hypothetical protein
MFGPGEITVAHPDVDVGVTFSLKWKYQQWAATFPKRLVVLCDRKTILARSDRQAQTVEAA